MCTLFSFFGENYDVMSQKLIKKMMKDISLLFNSEIIQK